MGGASHELAGEVRIQISLNGSRTAYVQTAKRSFGGSETSEPVDVVLVSALGAAMASAVAVTDVLTRGDIASIMNIETAFVHSDDPARNRTVPQLTIKLKKNPAWIYEGESTRKETAEEESDVNSNTAAEAK
eukprot:TRINITY_DN190983_c0_g1_i1.p1 TRINITY_DN190983_c0_g1~~TRINITY_DN190983_c0_g1_i1.p1  ORF type:complete len:132 (-),score=13.82 TRINITY_DN190983_c0_g1_i1:139-534(-)